VTIPAAILSLSLLVAPRAFASLVFVQAGGTEGQGYAFTIDRTCLAFTANHVVANANQAELVSVQGERVIAQVHRRDEPKDLALLIVPEGASRSRPKLCHGESNISLQIPELITRRNNSKLILQRVPSRAGSLDQVGMQVREASADSIWFSMNPAAADSIAQGDSGATVWLGNVARRSDVEGRGTLVGMTVAVQGDAVRVLRADIIQQAVFALLWPLEIEKVRFSPHNARLVQLAWGPIPEPASRVVSRAMSWSSGVATVHFTLDLGDRDTVVESVSVGLLSLKSFGRRLVGAALHGATPRRTDLKVQTSQMRPGETSSWTDQGCFRSRNSLAGVCKFSTPIIARGIRIQLEGEVSQLTSVSLKVTE